MSIAWERSRENSFQRVGFIHDRPPPPRMEVFAGEREEEEEDEWSSGSSIGRDSEGEEEEDCEEAEVQSSCKGPFDTINALEEVLPIKKGISKFYNGKSKSFTSLADVSSMSSVKDFAKPENIYDRKRKILIAHANFHDKNRSDQGRDNVAAISKRSANSSGSALPFDLTPSCGKININCKDSESVSSSPSCNLPPVHPHAKRSTNSGSWSSPPQRNFPLRSLSLSNLQCAAATAKD